MPKKGNMKKLYRDNRGMSLVEVIIAITILGLVAVPVLHSLTTSMVYNQKARKRQEMTLTAESIMETFKGYDLDALEARFTAGGVGVEGVNFDVVDADSGFRCSKVALTDPKYGTETPDEYTFSINDMRANDGQLYDVTITATPNSVEKIMVQDNMETTRDAIFKGDRSFDTGALQRAKNEFSTSSMQSDLADYFSNHYSDAVIKMGTDIITIKDEINKVYEPAFASYYVGNYIRLHERRLEFEITEDTSAGEYLVKPKMVYSYWLDKYPYFKVVKPSAVPDEYENEGGAGANKGTPTIVQQSTYIRYPETDYLYFDVDLSSVCPSGVIYQNPTTAGLDRLFIYYYPQYNVNDKIVIKNTAGISNFQCYVLKQRASDINDTTMTIKETGYHANVEINNSASGFEVFHNFAENMGNSKEPTASPSISGTYEKASSYVKTDASGKIVQSELADRFSETQTLSYKLVLEVTQNGRTITTLESSMNEKIK